MSYLLTARLYWAGVLSTGIEFIHAPNLTVEGTFSGSQTWRRRSARISQLGLLIGLEKSRIIERRASTTARPYRCSTVQKWVNLCIDLAKIHSPVGLESNTCVLFIYNYFIRRAETRTMKRAKRKVCSRIVHRFGAWIRLKTWSFWERRVDALNSGRQRQANWRLVPSVNLMDKNLGFNRSWLSILSK